MKVGFYKYKKDSSIGNRMATDSLLELDGANLKYEGLINKSLNFIKKKQLQDASLWKRFVRLFVEKTDSADRGWSGEFWGKLMIGASIVYTYDEDEELYATLEKTVKELLSTENIDGSISTYEKNTELSGWDVWCRKYVLLGLENFYDICRDDALKAKIKSSLCRQMNYIIMRVGEEEGKIPLTETSDAWFAVNSCSILEAIVKLYNITQNEKYKQFAKYVIDTGGCKNGDLLRLALENSLMPYEYPVKKAYEMTSFFEGVLEFYRITGEEKYFIAVRNYVNAIAQSDLSIIGCCGCDEEVLNNGTVTQTEPKELMQETCVTVTWMRICYQLLCLTGDIKYAELIEQSAYNALYAAVNYEENSDVYYIPHAVEKIALPFDSYSPLTENRRGIVPAGYRLLPDNTYYGCCASFGATGVGIVPAVSVMRSKQGFVFNIYEQGVITTSYQHVGVKIYINSDYPKGNEIKLNVRTEQPVYFEIKLRLPTWAKNAIAVLNGEATALNSVGEYTAIAREWNDDCILLSYNVETEVIALNGKKAIKRGAFIYARDERFAENLSEEVDFQKNGAELIYRESKTANFHTNSELEIECTNGRRIHLCDYASAGTDWQAGRNKITVWMK